MTPHALVTFHQGFNLLYYLESVVGTEQFEEFAQAYISRWSLWGR